MNECRQSVVDSRLEDFPYFPYGIFNFRPLLYFTRIFNSMAMAMNGFEFNIFMMEIEIERKSEDGSRVLFPFSFFSFRFSHPLIF